MSTGQRPFPPFRSFLWASVLLGLLGWGGLAVLVVTTLPTLFPRWMFFYLFMCALSGLALPVAYFLNLRFRTHPPATSGVILREAMWVGIYGCLVAWLQIGRMLTPLLALVLACGFAIVEVLLRIYEISRWQPEQGEDEPPA
jgi:hypothetical protein